MARALFSVLSRTLPSLPSLAMMSRKDMEDTENIEAEAMSLSAGVGVSKKAVLSVWQRYKNLTNLVDMRQLRGVLQKKGTPPQPQPMPIRFEPSHPPLFSLSSPIRMPHVLNFNSLTSLSNTSMLRDDGNRKIMVSISTAGNVHSHYDSDGYLSMYSSNVHASPTSVVNFFKRSLTANMMNMSLDEAMVQSDINIGLFGTCLDSYLFGAFHKNKVYIMKRGNARAILGFVGTTPELKNVEIVMPLQGTEALQVTCIEIRSEHGFLILATGIWEHFTGETAAEVVAEVAATAIDEHNHIADRLIVAGAQNMGAIVVCFN